MSAGMVELDDRGVRVTPRGRHLLRAVAMPFDACRDPDAAAGRTLAS